MATQHQYYHSASLPLNVPSKSTPTTGLYLIGRVAGSPPEISDSSTTGGGRTSGHSLASGSVNGDCESSNLSYSGIDVVDVLSDRMENVFDPTPLDKGLAMQAKTSGQLNAKQRELMELQSLAQRRLKGVRANFADGIKTARDTKRDLELTQKRVNGLKAKAERVYPNEFRRARKTYAYEAGY